MMADFWDRIEKAIRNEIQAQREEEQTELLTADVAEQLYWMNHLQLEAIYKHGKRKVRIDGDPKVYEVLRKMNPLQLKAIFGDEDI